MNLDTAIQNARRIYLDTSPLIYWVEEYTDYTAKMDRIIDIIESSPLQALTSTLTLAEVMVQPLRDGNTDLAQIYHDFLVSSADYRLVSVTSEIAISAGAIRARYALRTPDAIHAATAIMSDCDAILTNDGDFRRLQDINVLILDDLEL